MCFSFFSLSYSPFSWKNAVCDAYMIFIILSSGKSFAISRGIYDFPEDDGALRRTLIWEFSLNAESIARNTRSLFILSCLIVRSSIRTISSHFRGANFDISVPEVSSLYRYIISSILPPFPINSDTSFPISFGREILYISFAGKRIERRLISFSVHFSQASSLSKHT